MLEKQAGEQPEGVDAETLPTTPLAPPSEVPAMAGSGSGDGNITAEPCYRGETRCVLVRPWCAAVTNSKMNLDSFSLMFSIRPSCTSLALFIQGTYEAMTHVQSLSTVNNRSLNQRKDCAVAHAQRVSTSEPSLTSCATGAWRTSGHAARHNSATTIQS